MRIEVLRLAVEGALAAWENQSAQNTEIHHHSAAAGLHDGDGTIYVVTVTRVLPGHAAGFRYGTPAPLLTGRKEGRD